MKHFNIVHLSWLSHQYPICIPLPQFVLRAVPISFLT
jgi:hypothetical protein